ncbi:uncharacterized protein LOC119556397 [Drosophila subpulchrella]|uniref:uncharacterized protein LOC119556397 n=1 Tax=Drosophila subpulchrella TaxID=1486046 RepID=UPI0018A1300B|nr:uncharacterized protein LOC119556397 [Drosophila subpulchrella]
MPKHNELKNRSKRKYGQRDGKHVPRNEVVESHIQMGVKIGASDTPLSRTEKGVVDLSNKTIFPQQNPQHQLKNVSEGNPHGILEEFKENVQQNVTNTQQPSFAQDHIAFLDQWRSKWNRTLMESNNIVLQEHAEALLPTHAVQKMPKLEPISSKYQSPSSKDPAVQGEDSPIDLSYKNGFHQAAPMATFDFPNTEPEKSQAALLEVYLSGKDSSIEKPVRKSDASRLVSLDHQYVKVKNPKAALGKTIWNKNNLCDHSLAKVKNPKQFRSAKEKKDDMERLCEIETICMRLRDIEVPNNVGIVKGPVTFEDVFDVLGIKEEQQEPQLQVAHPPAEPIPGKEDQQVAVFDNNMALEEDLGPDDFDSIFDYLGLEKSPPVDPLLVDRLPEYPLLVDLLPVDLLPVDPLLVDLLPVDPLPVDPLLVDPLPVFPSPVVPPLVDPSSVVSSPVVPSPVDPSEVFPFPVFPSPVVPSPVDPSAVVPFPVILYPVLPPPVVLTGKEDAMTDWTDSTDSEDETDQSKEKHFHTVVVVTQGEEEKYIDVEHVDPESSEEESLTDKENTDEEEDSFNDSDWTMGNEEESDTE